MNIAHYILGIPPLRGGGLIKYAIDLAEMQNTMGHTACILYPGQIEKEKKNQSIHKKKKYHGVVYYEILNPLPVSMASGMCDTSLFMEAGDKNVYLDFLKNQNIAVLHVHSLMGLHIELAEAAKELGIKILFTSHDYFGICPKTNLLNSWKEKTGKDSVCEENSWENCQKCISAPDSYDTLVRRQSHWFELYAKCEGLVQAVKKIKRVLQKRTQVSLENELCMATAFNKKNSYPALFAYYKQIFALVDCMHYNSEQAKRMYERFLGERKHIVLPVLHGEITDKRKIRTCHKEIRFGFLGNMEPYKGFPMLKTVLDRLWKTDKYKFKLHVYFAWMGEEAYIQSHRGYRYNEIDKVFDNMDVLLVPSQWAETYGFVVLEAIMHGIPVLVSEYVGAKDLVLQGENIGKIIRSDSIAWEEELEWLLEHPEEICKMNKNICNSKIAVEYKKYCWEILELYQSL